jgi:hypothetical protein
LLTNWGQSPWATDASAAPFSGVLENLHPPAASASAIAEAIKIGRMLLSCPGR